MYMEMYSELEKVRNMLLIQHNINEQHLQEVVIVHVITCFPSQETKKLRLVRLRICVFVRGMHFRINGHFGIFSQLCVRVETSNHRSTTFVF